MTVSFSFGCGGRDSSNISRTRKIIFTLLILLSLFLIGTVIVLSSVSYFLAIPQWAYLTESEVPWLPKDAIQPLSGDEPLLTNVLRPVEKRQEWEIVDGMTEEDLEEEELRLAEAQAADKGAVLGVLGSDTIPAVWDKLESEIGSTTTPFAHSSAVTELPSSTFGDDSEDIDYPDVTKGGNENEGQNQGEGEIESDEDDAMSGWPSDGEESQPIESEIVWGPDGMGTGGYWMRADWDGRVQETKSWDRLYNVSNKKGETIPRLIHQTWKNDILPEKWRKAWRECREGMPDYEYMLWTDDLAREFVATHYPSQLEMYDGYTYTIQRADAIRYFILDHFGGIYMDLDIGCRRRLDPLLQGDWEVILPVTKPVGVSNDLIFSSRGSAFMRDTVNGLASFDHTYLTNYPTVMFSTGPMFLSAQYSLYSSSHPLSKENPRPHVRILPKSLYGKNAPQEAVPHSFFSHYYGSSWHADDAGFITFLGNWGRRLMYLGAVLIIIGALRLVYLRSTGGGAAKHVSYQLLPTSLLSPSSDDSPNTTSSASSLSRTSQAPFRPLSPNVESPTSPTSATDFTTAIRHAGTFILSAPASLLRVSGAQGGSGSARRQRGWRALVPSIFQTQQPQRRRHRTASEASQLPLRRPRRDRSSNEYTSVSPPPYDTRSFSGGSNGGPPRRGPIVTVTDMDRDVDASEMTTVQGGGSGRGREKDQAMDEVDAFLKDQFPIEVGVASAGESSEGSDEIVEDEEKDDWEWKET